MARYRLACAIAGSPTFGPYARWGAGTIIADTQGNALPGDIVWTALCVAGAPNPDQLIPLDASAATAIGGAIGVYSPKTKNFGVGASG